MRDKQIKIAASFSCTNGAKFSLLVLLFLFGKCLHAQAGSLSSNAVLDSLLQSKNWYCLFPIGSRTMFDSLHKEKVLTPHQKLAELSYTLMFKNQSLSCEGPLSAHCGTESHSLTGGIYYLNGNSTITCQMKWQECRGLLCFGENKHEELQLAACTYRIFVLDDRLVFKLIE